MDEDARQRGKPGLSACNRVRRRQHQHQQQRQQQQDQRDPYPAAARDLPDKQHQARHPDNPPAPLWPGDQ